MKQKRKQRKHTHNRLSRRQLETLKQPHAAGALGKKKGGCSRLLLLQTLPGSPVGKDDCQNRLRKRRCEEHKRRMKAHRLGDKGNAVRVREGLGSASIAGEVGKGRGRHIDGPCPTDGVFP